MRALRGDREKDVRREEVAAAPARLIAAPTARSRIGGRFPGAAWGNLRLGIENAPQWERVAVVTDVSWLRDTINALRFLMQAEVRVFSTSDACQGRAWISSTS